MTEELEIYKPQRDLSAVNDAQRAILTQQTPKDAIKTRKGKGGKMFHYVKHTWTTEQLNVAFNWSWSWEIMQWQIIPSLDNPIEVFTLGKLTIHTPNGDIVKMQFGTSDVKRDREGKPLSIGDDLKAASSDGLKKAASLLGLALDVYSGDDDKGNDDGGLISDDPMTAFWAAAKAKGLTQAEGAALLQKHKGNPDLALKELATNKPTPAEGNGKLAQAEPTKAEIEAAKRLFFDRIIKEIPFYHNTDVIGSALKASGFTTYSQAKEAEMLAALQKCASREANKKAA